jgi:hypothetical protein
MIMVSTKQLNRSKDSWYELQKPTIYYTYNVLKKLLGRSNEISALSLRV